MCGEKNRHYSPALLKKEFSEVDTLETTCLLFGEGYNGSRKTTQNETHAVGSKPLALLKTQKF